MKKLFLKLTKALVITLLTTSVTFFSSVEAHLLSCAEEYGIGNEAITQYRAENNVESSPKLNQIMSVLLEANTNRQNTDQRKFQEIELSNENTVNAFSFPGGWTIVTEQMMDYTNGGSEDSTLAFVVGHEYGHFINEDYLRKYDKQFGTSTLFDWAGAFGGFNGPYDQLYADAAKDLLTTLNARQMNFRTEQQADEKAFELLCNTEEYSPGGGAVFFHRLVEDEKVTGKVKQNFTYPHSASDVRLKRVLDQMKKISKGRVEFKNNKFYLDGKLFGPTGVVPPSSDGKLTGIERTYILAGNIAKAISKGEWRTNNIFIYLNSPNSGAGKVCAGDIFIINTEENEAKTIGQPIGNNIVIDHPTEKSKMLQYDETLVRF